MKLKKSFTLIELLIVIAIIGILSSLVILNITTGRDEANNAKRVQEANGLVKALNIYYNQNYSWPTGMTTTLKEVCNTNLTSPDCTDMVDLSGMGDILPNIPIDPSAEGDGTGYWVAYNHGSNEPMVVPGLYQTTCPEGYISVPGNSYYNTLPGFCVMKWEAKAWDTSSNQFVAGGGGDPDLGADWADSSYIPKSASDAKPWVRIRQEHTTYDAKDACSAVNTHLITNNEWMTITRNAEAMSSNWTSGVIGTDSLFRGNSNTSASMDGTDPLSGINTRTHTLTNGEVVWDMAGNVWNWTDNTVPQNRQPTANADGVGWSDFTSGGISRYLISSAYYNSSLSYEDVQPSNPNWHGSQGVGRIYHYSNDSSTTIRAFLRGGNWDYGTYAGLFALTLHSSPTGTCTSIGFRCAR